MSHLLWPKIDFLKKPTTEKPKTDHNKMGEKQQFLSALLNTLIRKSLCHIQLEHSCSKRVNKNELQLLVIYFIFIF